MKFISKTCWKKLFETALQKQQQLAPSIEHPTTLPLKMLVKLKSLMVRKFPKTRLKFNIVFFQSTEAQENTYVEVSLIKFLGRRTATLLIRDSNTGVFL